MRKSSLMLLPMLASGFVAQTAMAVPLMETGSLPLENSLLTEMGQTAEGKEALKFVMGLITNQDDATSTKYYYSPTFRVSTNAAGAATLVTNETAVDRRSEIDGISSELMDLKTGDFLALRSAYNKLTKRLGNTTNPTEIAAINTSRAAIKAQMDEVVALASENEGELPAYVLNAKLERMADVFGLSGFSTSVATLKDVTARTKLLGELSASNGGIFSGNVYAGLTSTEIGYVRSYKEARAKLGLSTVTIAVLPLQSIEFFPLAETYLDSFDHAALGIPLFRSMSGSGNFTGATFNFDLTLDGAEKFSVAPPPIVVPIGVKATLTVKPPTFSAKLSCDFTTGWTVKGRTDVKDGLIIYNNDIFSTMVAKDVSETNKPCKVTITGGSGTAAEYAYAQALQNLQTRLEDLFFTRTNLAKQEKDLYWKGVQEDIAANRHQGANSGWSGLFGRACGLGFVGTIIGAFGQASRFYWHTDVRDITSLSTVKFEEEIVIDQNKTISFPLATTDMCLAWNPGLQRYVACTEEEERGAQTVNDAFTEAEDSCDTSMTASECAGEREETAPISEAGNIQTTQPPAVDPTSLPDEI